MKKGFTPLQVMKSALRRKLFGCQQENIKLVTGFTLVETLVAVSILTLAIAGPLAVSSLAISESQHARNQITASYLAQDAMESVLNLRDANFIIGNDWLTDLVPCDATTDDKIHCQLSSQKPPLAVSACVTNVPCPKLKYSATTGFYSYESADSESIFTRDIKIKKVGTTDNNILITVTMTWPEANGSQTYTLKSFLNKLQ